MRNKIVAISIIFLCISWGYIAHERNKLFSSNVLIWEDSLKKSPNNWFNRIMLGNVYMNHLRLEEAKKQLYIAKVLAPNEPTVYKNLATLKFLESQNVVDAIRKPGKTLFIIKK